MGNSRTAGTACGRAPWAALASAFAPVMAALVLSYAAPAASDGDGAAVWVPLAPAYDPTSGTPTGPVVLVPYEQSVNLPAAARLPQAWVPDYLSHGSVVPNPPAIGTRAPGGMNGGGVIGGAAPERLRNMPRRDDFGLAGLGLSREGKTRAPAMRGVTFSDLLDDARWRRDTAKRLRAQPGFEPKF